ncbi:hypothetical protein [Ruegeria jejuensis]|uniref:hypothetical protein n=1 Tax=Ruegeria jejuensis TaxID=3233338 RepID=UPI00355BDA11
MDATLHTITFLGFKGGIGRSASAAALAHGLAALGYHVALVDAGHAVPLQEHILSEQRGRGLPPEESSLFKFSERIARSNHTDGRVQYIRATTAAHLETVIEQLWCEDWHYAVVDTPAHQTASVFEAAGQSSLLIIPARYQVDAIEVRETLPPEFLERHHLLRCMVVGSDGSEALRAAFAPLMTLATELPCTPTFAHATARETFSDDVEMGDWLASCLAFAHEVVELMPRQEQLAGHPPTGVFAI